jgi:hypothetical protein
MTYDLVSFAVIALTRLQVLVFQLSDFAIFLDLYFLLFILAVSPFAMKIPKKCRLVAQLIKIPFVYFSSQFAL